MVNFSAICSGYYIEMLVISVYRAISAIGEKEILASTDNIFIPFRDFIDFCKTDLLSGVCLAVFS